MTKNNRLEELLDEISALVPWYRFLTEKTRDIIWTADRDLILTYISPSVEKVLGFAPEYFLKKTVTKRLAPASAAMAASILKTELQHDGLKGMDPERSIRFELEFRHRDGSPVWLECVANFIRDDSGAITGFLGVSHDITDRKKAEETRRMAEVKYQRLYESLMDAFVSTDMNGDLREYNQVYASMLGYHPDQIKTSNYQDFTPEKWHALDRKIRDQVLKKGYSDIYEKEYRRKDGSIFPIESRISLIRDERGKPAGMCAIVRDISERKDMESRMKKYQDQLEVLVRERTSKLEKAVDSLKLEIKERKKSESALRERERELSRAQQNLEEMNTTLKVMIKQVAEDKEQSEQLIISNIKFSVLPYLEKLKNSGLRGTQLTYCCEVESHLKELSSSFVKMLSSDYIGLSPTEIQVASLIREGKSSKDIAKILNISVYTVTSHRYHIRKKIGMKGTVTNLRSYLLSLK